MNSEMVLQRRPSAGSRSGVGALRGIGIADRGRGSGSGVRLVGSQCPDRVDGSRSSPNPQSPGALFQDFRRILSPLLRPALCLSNRLSPALLT
jgi:hypothetical protein